MTASEQVMKALFADMFTQNLLHALKWTLIKGNVSVWTAGVMNSVWKTHILLDLHVCFM